LTAIDNDVTQEIDYSSCDTITTGLPTPTVWTWFSDRWDRIWPPLVGIFLGTAAAIAFWLLALLWWLNA
jgi:hypothetical protein